ncbi:trans-aconitate methyltransferase [Streptacidiphilus sp. MAP12-33]|uniref:class I SAM-dependent methyltransferase n=1 Tax=Streptacidiphilus sp. MAP12-33 TaxID=3156266 RepID=UPI003518BF89
MTDTAPHAHEHDHDQARILDLDADVLAGHLASIVSWLPLATAPRRVVDLGCGTGAGTFALLDRFPQAEVTAVDAAAGHLRRLREKAVARGVAEQVRTVQADLDTGLDADWLEVGRLDLVWASASLHHLAEPDRTLRRVHAALAPDGLLAVVELAGFPRFLPDDAPREAPGLEDRCHAVRAHDHAAHLPHRGADWGARLTATGFTVEGTRTVTAHLTPEDSAAVGPYALTSLRRMRTTLTGALSARDLAALDRLLDADSPHSLLRREDLAVRTERSVWAARRG